MKPGRHVWLNGTKATFCGLTTTGLAKVHTAGKLLTVRTERVRTCRERADKGGKHRSVK